MDQQARAAALVDVFVYVVVLNLFVEYLPDVVTETFTVSLLTAVLLKVVLEVVLLFKGRAVRRFRAAETVPGRIGAGLLLWLVLFGSKFAVLELVDLVFGDRADLGGFLAVSSLIVVLMAARGLVRRLLSPVDESSRRRAP